MATLKKESYLKLLKEQASVKIPVKHPGALEVPEGKDVEDLALNHFKDLIKKKSWPKISKALINLKVWNKDREPKLSKWADDMQEKLAKWVDSERSSSGNENLYEQKVKIPVKHPGVLEVPAGKDVESLPYSHFANLVKRKGFGEISKALTNLQTWNQDRNPKLANWADKMQQKLHNEFSEEAQNESANIEEKWDKDVEVKSTGEEAGKSIAQLKADIEALKGKPGNKKEMGKLLFALRAKQGWKKKTGL